MQTIDTADGPYTIYHVSEVEAPRHSDDTLNTGPWMFEPADYDGDVQWAGGERTELDAINAARRDAQDRVAEREAHEYDDKCWFCAQTLPAGECGLAEIEAVFIDAENEIDGESRMICAECLAASNAEPGRGPGYVRVEALGA